MYWIIFNLMETWEVNYLKRYFKIGGKIVEITISVLVDNMITQLYFVKDSECSCYILILVVRLIQ